MSHIRLWIWLTGFTACFIACKKADKNDEAAGPAQAVKAEPKAKARNSKTEDAAKDEDAVETPYTCGNPFQRSALPEHKGVVSQLLTATKYDSSPLPRALAMSDDGFGHVVVLPEGAAAEEAKRLAVNRCAALAGKPCKAIAVGDTFCPDGEEAAEALKAPTSLMDLPFSFEADVASWKSKDAAAYMQSTFPKAVAISIDGSVWFDAAAEVRDNRGNIISSPRKSNEEAARIALETCEIRATITPCTLFAMGNDIVFDPAKINRVPVIDYTKTALAKPALLIPDSTFDGEWVENFPRADPNLFRGVIYIGPLGGSFIVSPRNGVNNEAEAQAGCAARNNDMPCFKYAEGTQIVFSPGSMKATTNQTLHCKAVPRADCEAHKKMGCTAEGTYLVMDNDSVIEKTCR